MKIEIVVLRPDPKYGPPGLRAILNAIWDAIERIRLIQGPGIVFRTSSKGTMISTPAGEAGDASGGGLVNPSMLSSGLEDPPQGGPYQHRVFNICNKAGVEKWVYIPCSADLDVEPAEGDQPFGFRELPEQVSEEDDGGEGG